MRLRAKTLVAIGAMTAVVGLIVYVALVTNIRGQVTQLEERLTRDNTRRMVNAVERELDSLDTTVSDWSYWDDTYAFAQDGNSQYVDSNLGDDTFTTLGLGVFAIVDLAGQPIFARALDAESGTGVSVPAALATHLSPDGLLRALDPTVDGVKGIVMLDERPLLVVARPILTSLRAGPARGVLIMGRFFDDAFVEHLSNSTEIPVAAARYGDPDLPADFQLASESLGEADSLFVSLLDSRVAAGYALLNDIYGQPTLLLRAETSRDIWQQSIATLRYTIAVLTLLGLISGAAILLFLEFLILAPLTRLSADVARVGAGGDPGARVAETGRDELGRLAQRINGMLHSLQESQDGLRQSEERYRLLIESAHDMIASIAPDGRFLVVNRAWLETMGFPQARCPELHLLDIVHPDSQTACRAAIAAALAGQSPSDLQITLLGANGQVVIVKGNLSGQRHAGSVVAVQLFFRDITLQRQAEEEREILVEAIEQAGEMVVIMGTDRKVRYVNPAFETITGYARAEALGHYPDFLAGAADTARRDGESGGSMWSTVLAGHVWHGHFVNRKKDGTTYEEDATISPMRDASGKIVSFVGVLRDVTEQIALEAKLRQSQKMEALGTLAGGVAHDFNNLLTAILGHANLLKVAARSDEGTLDSIAVIEKAAERAADLTRQLLGFARPTRLESSRVDLHDSIDTVVRLLSRTLEKNITLVKHLRAPRPDVIGDPGQIEQVLLNLAVNARDAMPEGGELLFETGSIEIKADEGLWAMQIPPGDYVVISVADTGMGIPTQIQHRIFEPFFTTKAPGKGTGMGLATAYSIIAEHKGTIQMRSQPGLGTTFKIYLPLAAPATQGKGTLQGLEPVAGVGTVMVVDDEELVRETAADMLRRLGYSAVTFASGPEAIAYYAQSMAGVDLVLMDLAMPEMDGSKCFLSLRALNPQVKALLMSGFAPGNVIEAILSEGILGFVGKPFSLADLSIKVAKALGRG